MPNAYRSVKELSAFDDSSLLGYYPGSSSEYISIFRRAAVS